MNYSCGGDTMQRESGWECDSCRSAPAAVYCRADAAALCAACDADIHAANPISRRHHRVPVSSSSSSSSNYGNDESKNYFEEALLGEEEVVDEYLQGHLVEFDSKQNIDGAEQVMIKNGAVVVVVGERVVPVPQGLVLLPKKNDRDHGMGEYEDSDTGFCYSSAPLGHTVSLPSMEASHIVPDSTDDSNPYAQPPKGAMELFLSSPPLHLPSQFSPMDREARVLRYREKKKSRKFEKTIRYASRKAYAEARPRIKGRFAKRMDVEELEVDKMFSSYAIPEDSYGVVPSF